MCFGGRERKRPEQRRSAPLPRHQHGGNDDGSKGSDWSHSKLAAGIMLVMIVDLLLPLLLSCFIFLAFWLFALSFSIIKCCLFCLPAGLLISSRLLKILATHFQVSMPTGSLCAERNAIGSALAADLSLLRQELKMVAVLGLALPVSVCACAHGTIFKSERIVLESFVDLIFDGGFWAVSSTFLL